jgi:hypothetical protein
MLRPVAFCVSPFSDNYLKKRYLLPISVFGHPAPAGAFCSQFACLRGGQAEVDACTATLQPAIGHQCEPESQIFSAA